MGVQKTSNIKKGLLFLLLSCSLNAVHYQKIDEDLTPPWFTGPLIATGDTTIPGGHINFEPYVYFTDTFATYNNNWKSVKQPDFWSLSYQFPLWIGLSSWADIVLVPTVNWNHTQHQSQWVNADFTAAIEFQLHRSKFRHEGWIPSIKLALWQTFPTGKYRNLSEHKHLTDLGGAGSYTSELRLIIGRMENCYDDHYFQWVLNFNYTIPSLVHVKGLNAYGGGHGTRGTVHPGRNFEIDLGMQYNLTRHWALALDLIGTYQSKGSFHGRSGVTKAGTPAANGTRAYIQYSVAPALEYNFSANLGIIGGCWMTVAGKNAGQFISGVFALNYFR